MILFKCTVTRYKLMGLLTTKALCIVHVFIYMYTTLSCCRPRKVEGDGSPWCLTTTMDRNSKTRTTLKLIAAWSRCFREEAHSKASLEGPPGDWVALNLKADFSTSCTLSMDVVSGHAAHLTINQSYDKLK